MTEKYRHEMTGACLTIWNCNPAMRNALSPEYYQGLLDGLSRAATDPSIAAVVLAGEGGFFCSGGDLNTLKLRREMSEEERRTQIENLSKIIRTIKECPKPVIAAVEGGAAGAGLSIAMACDMVLAGESAKFTLAYVKAGLVPDGGATYSLIQAMPRATVARMAMLAKPLGAKRMFDLGAVTEVLEDGAVVAAAHALGAQIANGPEQAITVIKQLLNSAETATLSEQLDAERDAMAHALGGDEAQTGIKAFLNKEKPVFR
ncbi:oxepin-CoA hydrolase, alternative type [Shimia thalassica]|uniref:oxepin-CoA hydrolase, alternative type n=1 Tax=Shimia thalassica TaxID=1715693 RepID=UPI002733516D|nr:enoyl-CoA hydratase family protein [Shimia thalassica]MDP2520306.1 enoyl-CoA hydratase family protein [Shimia thalassica]